MKKEIRDGFINRLKDMAFDTNKIIQCFDLPELPKCVKVINILHKGEMIAKCKCSKCGHEYTKPKSYSGYLSEKKEFACENCENDDIVSRSGFVDRRALSYSFARKTENGFEYTSFDVKFKFIDAPNWHETEPIYHIGIRKVAIFDKTYGLFCGEIDRDKCFKVIRKNSQMESSVAYWLQHPTDCDVEEEEWNTMCQELRDFMKKEKNASLERSNRKREKKEEEERAAAEERARIEQEEKERHLAELLADPRCQYQAAPVDLSSKMRYPIFFKRYSSKDDGTFTYMTYCSKCCKQHEIDNFEYEGACLCQCGNYVSKTREYDVPWGSTSTQNVLFFENTNLPENDLLIRCFEITTKLVPTDNGDEFQRTILEYRRVFVREGQWLNYYQDKLDGGFDTQTNQYFSHMVNGHVIQSNEQIVEIVNNSVLKYSGLVDSWGLGKYQYSWKREIPNLQYLYAWCQNPGIEIIVKSNFTELADHMITCPQDMYPGKTIHEILGIDKGMMKLINGDKQISYTKMIDIQDMYNVDPTITIDVYDEVCRTNLKRYFKDVAYGFGITYANIIEYLQDTYDHQCIDKDEAISVWRDYLEMASKIGVDLTDKSKRFPKSLKKEHDVAVFAYRAIKVQIDQQAFVERAKLNGERYNFEYKDIIAVVPQTPQEIVEEAQAQRNCLRSYIERVRAGSTVVVFVRHKDEPEKTFLSAEIYDGKLTQLKGFGNKDVRDAEIREFVHQWAKEKKFIPQCL